MKITKRFKEIIEIAIMLAPFFLIWNAATWSAGFYHDDAVTSTYYGAAKLNNQNAYTYANQQLKDMAVYQGRFAPAYNFGITTLLIFIGENLTIYRIWHSLWLFASILTTTLFVVQITKQKTLGFIYFIIFISLMCVTTYHDSLLSYGVVLPQLSLFGFLSLSFIYKGLESAVKTRLAYSFLGALSLSISVLTSEFGLTFVACAVLLVYLKKEYVADLKWAIPPVMIAVFYVVFTIFLKGPNQYSGTSLGNLNLSSTFKTFLYQVSGTAPTAFIFSKMGQELFGANKILSIFFSPSFWITLVLISPSFYLKTTHIIKKEPQRKLFLCILGMLLVIIPAGMTSISKKYQEELMWGLGYMQTFLQLSGLSFLLLSCYLKTNEVILSTKLLNTFKLFFSIIFGFLFAMNGQINRLTVSYLNQIWSEPRDKMAITLSYLSKGIEPNISILMNRRYLARWETTAFVYSHTNKRPTIYSIEDLLHKGLECPSWFIDTNYGPRGEFLCAIIERIEDNSEYVKVFFQENSAKTINFQPSGKIEVSDYQFKDSADYRNMGNKQREIVFLQGRKIQVAPERVVFLNIKKI